MPWAAATQSGDPPQSPDGPLPCHKYRSKHRHNKHAHSITAVNRCAFVQTGVIGECNRDGFRQSRLLRVSEEGYEVHTVNHLDGGRLRLDLKQVRVVHAGNNI